MRNFPYETWGAPREICPPAAAQYFIERAQRIADSLELGIVARRGELREPQVTAALR
jgi:hypothetical protein